MNRSKPAHAVVEYVKAHGAITNRECRQILDLSYDRTIMLLGGLCKLGALSREGVASGTRYTLAKRKVSAAAVARFDSDFVSRST